MIIIDTLTAIPTEEDMRCSIGEYYRKCPAAKILAMALPQIVAELDRTGCTLVIVNQMRTAPVLIGNPERVPGGCALKHYAAMRLEVRLVERLKVGGMVVGQKIRVKTVKNKCAAPEKEAKLDLLFGSGLHFVN